MSERLIGAVAIEDKEISFFVSPFDPEADSLPQHIHEPVFSLEKPDGGYSTDFVTEKIKQFFDTREGDFAAIAISTFGVINTDHCTLLSVPSRDWQLKSSLERNSSVNLDFTSLFRGERWKETRIDVQNDATTAALGESSEHKEGSRDGTGLFVYVRVGAGINAGVLRHGRPLRYRHHPEIGHVRPMRHKDDLIPGCCDFHKNCYEGLATLPAIIQRAKAANYSSLDALNEEPSHKIWRIHAYYLAQVCVNLHMVLVPDCIVLGGSAMRDHVYDFIREEFQLLVGDYPRHEESKDLSKYIRPAKIRKYASLRGALWLAQLTAETHDIPSLMRREMQRKLNYEVAKSFNFEPGLDQTDPALASKLESLIREETQGRPISVIPRYSGTALGSALTLPTEAPEKWTDRRSRRSESPVAFIERVYAPWIGNGLMRAHLRELDRPLYHALAKWLERHPVPDHLKYFLQSRSDRVSAKLAELETTDPTHAYARMEDRREAERLYQAALRRQRKAEASTLDSRHSEGEQPATTSNEEWPQPQHHAQRED